MIRVIVEGLVKRFGAVAAVDGVSIELRPGEMTYVLGPAGSGKTTLARLVAGLEAPDDGEIYFGDKMVQSLNAHERKVGMVFDNLGLWPGLTVADNVGFALKVQKLGRQERRRRVGEALGGATDRQPGRPASGPVDGSSAATDGPGAGTRHRARFADSGRAARVSSIRVVVKSYGMICGEFTPRPQ